MELIINERIDSNVGIMEKVKKVKIGSSGIKIADGNYSSKYPRSDEFVSQGVPFIRANNFNNKTIVDDELYFITEQKHKTITKGHLKKNDILITTRGNIGNVAIVPERHEDSNINAQIVLLRCNKDWNPLFLLYVLTSNDVKKQLNELITGTALKQLSVNSLKKIEIPLPDLLIQQKIAEILDTADQLRQYNKQLIEKYEALTQSLFLEMFGNPVRNEKGWKTVQVESIASKEKHSIKAGPFGSSLKKEFYVQNGYKIYGQEQVIKDDMLFGNYYIDEKKYKELESCKVQKGDVLISLVGTYGKVSVIPEVFEKGIINPRLMKISPNKNIIRPDFLKFLLQSSHVEKQLKNHSRGGTMDIINVGIIRKIFIPLPPIKIQNQFAERVQMIEIQKQQAQEALAKSEDLFQSLLQRAFKGELN